MAAASLLSLVTIGSASAAQANGPLGYSLPIGCVGKDANGDNIYAESQANIPMDMRWATVQCFTGVAGGGVGAAGAETLLSATGSD